MEADRIRSHVEVFVVRGRRYLHEVAVVWANDDDVCHVLEAFRINV